MKTHLFIEAALLDQDLIAKHLQLKGVISGDAWMFEMPSRLEGKPVLSHVQYWFNLLAKKSEGKNYLQRKGYSFHLHCSAPQPVSVAISNEMLNLLVRQRLSIVFESR